MPSKEAELRRRRRMQQKPLSLGPLLPLWPIDAAEDSSNRSKNSTVIVALWGLRS